MYPILAASAVVSFMLRHVHKRRKLGADGSACSTMTVAAATWDVVFVVRSFPEEYRFHDRHYFMATPTEEVVQVFRTLGNDLEEVRRFLIGCTAAKQLACIGFRVEADDEHHALKIAKHHMEGALDGLSVLVDRNLPQCAPFVLIRRGNEPDARVFLAGPSTWAYMTPRDEESATRWKQRNEELFRALFPFFDVIAGLHPASLTNLTRQVLYAMKMYRHGAASGDYGIEFICKFTALEALVCAGETRDKGRLLRERIPSIFPPSEQATVTDLVRDLWKRRSAAVHEAKAFGLEHLREPNPLAVFVEDVERLFIATAVFALNHLNAASSVQELWPLASGYATPDYALDKRPKGMERFAVTSALVNMHVTVKGVGALNDACFSSSGS